MNLSREQVAIERARAIIKAHKAGMTPSQIAKSLNISRRMVDIRLGQAGVKFANENRSDVWSLDDDKRRAAFAEKAARAARKQLQAMP